MKIGVIKGSSIGDAVLSFPLLRNIRKNFPDAEIYFITSDLGAGSELIKKCPYVNKIIEFKTAKLSGRIRSAVKFAFMKTMKFDIVFDGAPVTEKSKKMMQLISAEKKITIENYNINRPIIDMDLSMLKKTGLKTDNGYLELFFNTEEKKEKDKILIFLGIDADYHRVWSNKNWCELLNIIHKKYPSLKFTIIGGQNNKKRATELIETCGIKEIEDLIGKLSIEKTVSMLKSCRVFVTTNGGPMHLGWAVGAKMVAIHGPSPDMWLPKSKNVINIMPHAKKPDSNDSNALYEDKRFSPDNIQPERVFAAFQKLMRARS
jgi:ADP-heptose:LPS heptosyltransferase